MNCLLPIPCCLRSNLCFLQSPESLAHGWYNVFIYTFAYWLRPFLRPFRTPSPPNISYPRAGLFFTFLLSGGYLAPEHSRLSVNVEINERIQPWAKCDPISQAKEWRPRVSQPRGGGRTAHHAKDTDGSLQPAPPASGSVPELGAGRCKGAGSHGYRAGDPLYFLPFVFAQAPAPNPGRRP